LKTCPKCFQENLDDSRFCKHCGTSLSAVEGDKAGDPLIGKTINGNFAVKRKLAVGGMGSIYEAEQVSLQKRVCIKVLHKHLLRDSTIIKRFHREARAASKLKHPNCINVIDFGQADNGVLYLAMDFVEGLDLAQLLEKSHPLGAERILRIMKQVAGALDEAHANGIIHRDLKPENIMVEQRRQAPDHVIVLDFGIAKIKEPGREDRETFQTMAGVVCGTPEYMSPEQIRGEELDARTDIYSLGVIMWQLFANRLPFVGATPIATVTKHLTERPEAPSKYCPDIPAPIESYLLKMMSKNRNDRPATALEIKERLEEIESSLKNRGAAAQRPSVYDPDLDATVMDLGPVRISDESRQAIAGMSLPDEPRQAAQRSPAARVEPAPQLGRPAPQPVASQDARTAPGASQAQAVAPRPPQRPIHDPLQRSMNTLDVGLGEASDYIVRPRSSSRKVLVLGVVAALLVAVVVAVIVLRRGPAPEPPVGTEPGDGAPAAVAPATAVVPPTDARDVVESPDVRAHDVVAAADVAKTPDAAAKAPDVVAKAPDAGPTTPAPSGVAKPSEAPLRVVSLAPSTGSTAKAAPARKPSESGGEGKARDYEKMGDKAFQGGNYAEAKAYFNLALKYASSAALHKKIGYCYKNLGRLDEARNSFRQYLVGLPADKRATEEQILKGQGLL